MRLQTVTPLILTCNEEANLHRVLEPLRWAKRIVVVDSFSTDATLDILGRHPAVDIYQRPFDSFAEQCNYGLGKIETEWVLSLDADYVLTDPFVDEVAALDDEANVDGYTARFTYCVDGTPLRASLYPPRTVLYRRDRGRYVADGHAHRLRLDGPAADLDARILHDDRKPLGAWLDAQRRYARHEAAKLAHASDLGFIDRLRRKRWIAPILTPLYCLFFKGLLLDGPAGWLYTVQRTYAELLLTLYLSEDDAQTAGRTCIAGGDEGSREPDEAKDIPPVSPTVTKRAA